LQTFALVLVGRMVTRWWHNRRRRGHDAGSETAQSPFADLLADQLDAERARHASLEQRGISVITTSGTLITLLLALAGLTGRASGIKLPDVAQWLLRVALILLPLAAMIGIAAILPGGGRSVGVHVEEVEKLMKDPTPKKTEQAQLKGLKRVARSTRWKKVWLLVALITEGLGIGFLAATVWFALRPG
jgi:hypothetical protein